MNYYYVRISIRIEKRYWYFRLEFHGLTWITLRSSYFVEETTKSKRILPRIGEKTSTQLNSPGLNTRAKRATSTSIQLDQSLTVGIIARSIRACLKPNIIMRHSASFNSFKLISSIATSIVISNLILFTLSFRNYANFPVVGRHIWWYFRADKQRQPNHSFSMIKLSFLNFNEILFLTSGQFILIKFSHQVCFFLMWLIG